MIPVASPLAQYRSHHSAIDAAIREVLGSGDYILGNKVETFERAFADYCGVAHGIGVGSGTAALSLCLQALDVGPGDEVITVSHTALATVAAIIATGATPVLVDVDPVTYTIDVGQLADVASSSDKLKAIVPVHLYGRMADMSAISEIGQRWGIPIVEDCAQATGAASSGGRAGSLGVAGCFSFYPTKNLGAIGDGGMVVTDDDLLAEKIVRLRQYGWDEDRRAPHPGVNSRLDELQAAILLAKLDRCDGDNARRRSIAGRYSAGLADLRLSCPEGDAGPAHVHHLYVVATDERTAIRKALHHRGVQTAIHYPVPVHRQPGYAGRVSMPVDLPVTDRLSRQVLSLPMYPELTDPDVEAVIRAVVESMEDGGH